MSSVKDFTDDCYKHYQTALNVIEDRYDNGYRWMYGEWDGAYGNVWIAMGGRPVDAYTNMRLTMDNYSYCRRWESFFGLKTLSKLAREFQEEIYIRSRLSYLGADEKIAKHFIQYGVYGHPAEHHLTSVDIELMRKYL